MKRKNWSRYELMRRVVSAMKNAEFPASEVAAFVVAFLAVGEVVRS